MKIGNYDIKLDANRIKTDLTATHADGTKLSIWEKLILLIKHNPMVDWDGKVNLMICFCTTNA